MRCSRVYTAQALEPGAAAILDARVAHYLLRVLRLADGDAVVLFNGDGLDYQAELRRDSGGGLAAMVTGSVAPGNESPLAITLVQAIGRGERMDYTLQKATELGVSRIQPISSERTGVKLEGSKRDRRAEHWQSVVNSACEQCGRAVVPRVGELMSLRHWLQADTGMQRLVLDPQAGEPLKAAVIAAGSVAVVIGPEGGFSDTELAAMKAAGVRPVSLGPRVLRTETAGPAAIAVLQAAAGDF